MKKLAILLMIPFLAMVSCKKDDANNNNGGNETSKFQTLKTYMVENDLDIPNVLSGWIVPAPDAADVQAFIDSYYIIDIRSQEAYDAGHIEGAVKSSLADILTTAANADKPILVVCFSGQSAGHAVMALRLSGYSDAKVLKYGMSGWSSQTDDSWENNVGNTAVGNSNWNAAGTAAPTSQTFGEPTLTTTASDGAGILAERVQAMLEGGFKSVQNTTVLDAPSNYFINNYWSEADLLRLGYIDGAFRIQPLSLENDEYLNYDPDKTAVTYCWTGQTSSMVTAYLNVIGYNAVSLSFGANGMIYDELDDEIDKSHKYTTTTVDRPIVTE
jgi:rhodanese-related sulfurtransferase